MSYGSVTRRIEEIKLGSTSAATWLGTRYFEQLVALAVKYLRGAGKRDADEEDVALLAFEQFLRGVQEGRFERLNNRQDLWQILAMLTRRRASDHRRSANIRRQHEMGESVVAVALADSELPQFGDVIASDEPTPELAAMIAETYRSMLACLSDDQLREVAVLKMQRYTNAEIALKLNCSERTVERWLRLIRTTWEQSEADQNAN